MFKDKLAISFFTSMVLGFFVWWFSLPLTGTLEPWDAKNGYYLIALGIAGALSGFLGGRRFWLWPITIIIGEIAAIFARHLTNPSAGADFFFPIGMIFLIIHSISSLVGSAIGIGVSRLIFKNRKV